MTHALRQHCGSFLYDSLRAQWLTDEERLELEGEFISEEAATKLAMTDPLGSDRGRLASLQSIRALEVAPPAESVISVRCAPRDWPLFATPTLTSIRVNDYKDKGGTVVSREYRRVHFLYVCVMRVNCKTGIHLLR